MRDQIFVSYRRADTGHATGRLGDLLEAHFPGKVFVDVQDVGAGQDFVDVIRSALGSAAAIVVLIGPNWLQGSSSGARLGEPNDYVTMEITEALSGGLAVLPVLVDGATMPPESSLPGVLRPLLRFNAVQLRHPTFVHDSQLVLDFAYKALGLVPPTMLERVLEAAGKKVGYGAGFRFDENLRSIYANGAIWAGLASAGLTLWLWSGPYRPEAEFFMISASGGLLGAVGKNSRTKRTRALVGLALAAASALALLVLAGRTARYS
jgi:hypothetical protein